MQRAFQAAYQIIPEGADGPSVPEVGDPDRDEDIANAIKAVLKKKGSSGATYSDEEKLAFFWYRYLFLGRSKPTTHIKALTDLNDAQLRAGCPDVLKRLVVTMKKKLRHAPPPPPQPLAPAEEAADAGAD